MRDSESESLVKDANDPVYVVMTNDYPRGVATSVAEGKRIVESHAAKNQWEVEWSSSTRAIGKERHQSLPATIYIRLVPFTLDSERER